MNFRISEWEGGEESNFGGEDLADSRKLYEVPRQREFYGIHERCPRKGSSFDEEFFAID